MTTAITQDEINAVFPTVADKMQARVACDLAYLRDWSPGLDLQILLRTLHLVLRGTNAY